tara:strand:- start:200 stop:445 length:246 start_codon:yes stop_codon:yes gene_type:complete
VRKNDGKQRKIVAEHDYHSFQPVRNLDSRGPSRLHGFSVREGGRMSEEYSTIDICKKCGATVIPRFRIDGFRCCGEWMVEQ